MPEVLRRLLAALPDPATPHAAVPALQARNRALLLIGFGAALRRSELVALQMADVTPVSGRGLLVRIQRSKTDPHGQGSTLAICANTGDPGFCALAAFEEWAAWRQDAAPEAPLFCPITSAGAVQERFLVDKGVARIIKQAAQRAGLDADRFSSHSLRRGLMTAAGDRQLPLVDLMRQSRHRSVQTALGYIEAADAWRNNVTEQVFAAN